MSLAEYGDGGTLGREARGRGERRLASRVAVGSAGRDERASAGRLPSRCPLWGMGGRARPARASVGVQASHLGASQAPALGPVVTQFRETH